MPSRWNAGGLALCPEEDSMLTITKRELVQRIAEKTGVQQINAKEVIQSFLDEIINELAKGNRLEFREFLAIQTLQEPCR